MSGRSERHGAAGIAGAPEPRSISEMVAWSVAAALICAIAVVLGRAPSALISLGALALAAAVWAPVFPEIGLVALLATSALDAMGRLARIGPVTVTAYQVVLGLVALLAALLVVLRRVRIGPSGIDLWLALLITAAAVGIPGAVDVPGALVAWVSLVSSVALVYLVRLFIRTPDQLVRVLIALLVLTAGLGLLAIVERAGFFAVQEFYRTTADGIRARVFFKDPNMLGGVLAAGAAVGFALALGEHRVARAIALWACVAFASLGVVATLSRGALLGLACGLAVAVLLSPLSGRAKAVLVVGGAASLLGLLMLAVDPRWIAEKLLGIGAESSALKRVYLARAAMEMYVDNPLGVGPGMWPEVLPAYRPYDLPASLLESHMTYLTLLVETGIVGLVGFLGALVSAGTRLVRSVWTRSAHAGLAWPTAAIAGGSTVLVVQSLTYSMETSKFLWFLIGAALVAASFASERERG